MEIEQGIEHRDRGFPVPARHQSHHHALRIARVHVATASKFKGEPQTRFLIAVTQMHLGHALLRLRRLVQRCSRSQCLDSFAPLALVFISLGNLMQQVHVLGLQSRCLQHGRAATFVVVGAAMDLRYCQPGRNAGAVASLALLEGFEQLFRCTAPLSYIGQLSSPANLGGHILSFIVELLVDALGVGQLIVGRVGIRERRGHANVVRESAHCQLEHLHCLLGFLLQLQHA